MDPAKYADLFLDESREHLTVINNQLLVLEAEPDTAGSVDAIFRSVHNLKGMSATMGFNGVARLSHAIETVLDTAGRLDVVVNNAGVGTFGVNEAFSLDQARTLYEINVFGVLRVMQAALPHLRRQQSLRVRTIYIGEVEREAAFSFGAGQQDIV